MTKVTVAAATWTALDDAVAAAGNHGLVSVDSDDAQVALKATAPTAGTAMTEDEAVEYVIGEGSTAKLYVYSTAGAVFTVHSAGAPTVIVSEGDGGDES